MSDSPKNSLDMMEVEPYASQSWCMKYMRMSSLTPRRMTRYQIGAALKRRRVRQGDIASRLGVSQAMVSRVIARSDQVSPAMANRVWAEIETALRVSGAS